LKSFASHPYQKPEKSGGGKDDCDKNVECVAHGVPFLARPTIAALTAIIGDSIGGISGAVI
jgi:hypothetical protein